jgi:hypothetical protein
VTEVNPAVPVKSILELGSSHRRVLDLSQLAERPDR